MKNINLLTRARAVIAHPDHWTIGTRTLVKNDGSTAHCALGALDVAFQELGGDRKYIDYADEPFLKYTSHPVVDLLASVINKGRKSHNEPSDVVAQFNNAVEHEDVIALFDLAIARQLVIDSMAEPVEVSAPVYLEDIMQRADRAALLVGV
jgi:hypothetical protein